MMVDNDWMDEVIAGDGSQPAQADERFYPGAIKEMVAQVRNDRSLSEGATTQQVNALLVEAAMTLRYEQAMHKVSSDALRNHVFSPIVQRPDPGSRDQTTPEELEAKADEIDTQARSEFEDGRRLLVEQVKDLHADGFYVHVETWEELDSLDDDGYVTEEMAEYGTPESLSQDARYFVRGSKPSKIDFSRDMAERMGREDEPAQGKVRDRDRQSYVEIEDPVASARVEEAAPAQQRDDVDVTEHIERHRREASKRPKSEPKRIGELMSDFMRQHGRGEDGRRLDEPQADVNEPEL